MSPGPRIPCSTTAALARGAGATYRRRASLLGRATLLLSLVVLFFAIQLVRGSP